MDLYKDGADLYKTCNSVLIASLIISFLTVFNSYGMPSILFTELPGFYRIINVHVQCTQDISGMECNVDGMLCRWDVM